MFKTGIRKIYNRFLIGILDSDATDKFWKLRTKAKAGGYLDILMFFGMKNILRKEDPISLCQQTLRARLFSRMD